MWHRRIVYGAFHFHVRALVSIIRLSCADTVVTVVIILLTKDFPVKNAHQFSEFT